MPPSRTTARRAVRNQPLPEFMIRGCNLFDRLPLEIVRQIGLEFHQNHDLYFFSSICQATFNALDRDDKHFWRLRFLRSFDPPDWPPENDRRRANARFKRHYMARQSVLCDDAVRGFASGYHDDEMETLKLLRDLLVEADTSGHSDDPPLKNLGVVIRFVNRLKSFEMFFFDEVELYHKSRAVDPRPQGADGRPYWNPLLLMVQCMLAPMTLGYHNRWKIMDFSTSQSVVYASVDACLLVRQGTVNFETILHHINFWTCHLLKDATGAIKPWYDALDADDRPSFWSKKLYNTDIGLDSNWKGTYAYLDDEDYIKYCQHGNQGYLVQDEFLGEGVTSPFQDLELNICGPEQHYWPDLFEEYLQMQPTDVRARTRAQGRSFQEMAEYTQPLPIKGHGVDQGEQFFMSGWLEQMPDQMSVPGWRRLIMMKYYIDEGTGIVDEDGLWAYEGIVFPGNRMIVGRWWYPSGGVPLNKAYRGPFILWATRSASIQSGS